MYITYNTYEYNSDNVIYFNMGVSNLYRIYTSTYPYIYGEYSRVVLYFLSTKKNYLKMNLMTKVKWYLHPISLNDLNMNQSFPLMKSIVSIRIGQFCVYNSVLFLRSWRSPLYYETQPPTPQIHWNCYIMCVCELMWT